jgi:hypothetical protein
MSAVLLVEGTTILHNVPNVSDTRIFSKPSAPRRTGARARSFSTVRTSMSVSSTKRLFA